MHRLAEMTVRQALAAGARLDPLEHYDDLAALDAAARGADALPTWRECELLDMPVIVGDPERGTPAVLWPPSYAALEWIEERLSGWFQSDTLVFSLAIAWALSVARDPDALAMAATPRACRRLARAWAGRLNCGLPALFRACTLLLNNRDGGQQVETRGPSSTPAAPRGGPDRRRSVLARLSFEFHQPDEYWLFGPLDRLAAAMDLLHKKDEAEDRIISKRDGKAAASCPDNPEVLAFMRWRAASDAFLKKFCCREAVEDQSCRS